MVEERKAILILLILVLVSVSPAFFPDVSQARGDNIEYHLRHQWTKIWILTNGTIDLLYDLEITCDQGEIRRVDVLQPAEGFTIREAKDSEGRILRTESIIEGDWYAARVWLSETVTARSTVRFMVVSNVKKMIWEDETNQGNAGMQFIPATWKGTTTRAELRVAIALPKGVTTSNIKTTKTLWDNAYYDGAEEGKLVLYWERKDWDPGERFECGVSFPKEYVGHYERRQGFFDSAVAFLTARTGVILSALLIVGIVARVARSKKNYLRPVLSIESLGVRRGLTAVEAAALLDLPPPKMVILMLYGLMKKQAVWVIEAKPTLKLKMMESLPEPLHYYEGEFIKAIENDGRLNESRLAEAIMVLRSGVQRKMAGYCRKDTVDYYRNTLNKAWEEVRSAQTPELMSNAYDERLLWLLLDENFQEKTEELFRDTSFLPNPGWWWYRYNDGYYSSSPRDIIERPSEPLDLREIPGVRFADTAASAMEQTAQRFVSDIEKFTDSIVPEPSTSEKASQESVHHKSSCVCACASCACACACVSCACACASGGGGVG